LIGEALILSTIRAFLLSFAGQNPLFAEAMANKKAPTPMEGCRGLFMNSRM
jgi:hypothetical protein